MKRILFGKKKIDMRTVKKLLLVFVVITLGLLFWDRLPAIDESVIKSSVLMDYPSEFNYVQTVNDCGPFSVAAVVRALKGEEVDSNVFVEEIKWRLPNGYTLPWGLEKQLGENGVEVEKVDVEGLSDDEKVLFLQEKLSLGMPVIILGEVNGIEHYVTVFGFDSEQDEFYLYDSLYQKDENDGFPGNRVLSNGELLDFWGGGGMYGFYEWYAIVASF